MSHAVADLDRRVPEIGFLPTTGALMDRAARLFGDKELLVSDRHRMTYAQINQASRQLALKLLNAGVGKGTRVGAQYPYGADWIVAWLAVTRIGALFVPLSTAYKPAEFGKVLRLADIHIVLCPTTLFGEHRQPYVEEAVPGLRGARSHALRSNTQPFLRGIWMSGDNAPAWALSIGDLTPADAAIRLDAADTDFLACVEREVVPADLCMTIYTSGTTSDPKGVVHSHGAMVRHCAALAHMREYKAGDRIFAGMPFFWVGGISTTVMPAMYVGATILCVERFDLDRVLDLMENERATRIVAWLGSLQKIVQGVKTGARKIPAMDDPVFSPLVAAPHSFFGMTETCSAHAGAGPDSRSRPLPAGLQSSMGPPLPYIEHRFTDPDTGELVGEGEEGVISVRGYNLMQGIAKKEREEVFSPDGWYLTGDRGFMRDGLLFFTGRVTEMIKTSGNNVAPSEVEAALLAIAGIQEAFVVGVSDRDRDEMVAAAVVVQPGISIDAALLDSRLREKLSNYKVPKRFLFLMPGDVPMLATDKPDRLAVRKMLQAVA